MGTKPNVLENLKLSFDLKETAASTETETTEQQSKLKNIAIEEPTGDTFVRSKSGLADNLSEIDEKRLETIFKRLRVGCHVHGTKESKETTRFRSRAKLRPTNMYRMLLDKQGASIRSSSLKHHKLQKCTDEVDATLHKTLEKNKILREPRLKLPKDIINKEHRTIKMSKSTSVYQEDVKTELFKNTDTENSTLVYKDNIEVETTSKGTACGIARSCSFEFKNSDHYGAQGFDAIDDTSPEELAAYFEQLLHIPKPMSSMAEMMYT